jgi:putative ABC transport system permease protein
MREELEALRSLAEPGELGNLTLAAEDARAVWGWTWLTSLVADIRYGFRTLLREPGFLAAAVLTLALGVGANTTIFSVINATILKPLPFPDSDRLVLLWKTFGKAPGNENLMSAPDFWDLKNQTHSFERVAIFDSSGRGYNLSARGAEPEQVSGLRVSADFFSVLGAKPMVGRSFLTEEELPGKDHEVILSYSLWKRRYGSDGDCRPYDSRGWRAFHGGGRHAARLCLKVFQRSAPTLGARGIHQNRLRARQQQLPFDRAS